MRHRYRTLSPPSPRQSHRDNHRDHRENHRHYDESFRPSHRYTTVDSIDPLNRRFSGSVRNELTCSKFDWENLLSRKNGSHVLNANSNRDERNVVVGSSSSPCFNGSFHYEDFGFPRKFSGVVPTTMSMENERYEMDPTRRITSSSYGLVHNRVGNSNLDNVMGFIDGKDEPLFVGNGVKESGSKRVMEDYDFIKERYGDVTRERDLVEKSREFERNVKDLGGDGVVYGRREVGLEHLERGEFRWREDYGPKRGGSGGIESSRDGLRRMPISYDGLYGVESSPRKERHLLEGDLDMDDSTEIMRKRQRFDVETTRHDQKRRFYNWDGTDNEVYDPVDESGQRIDEDDDDLLYQESLLGQSHGSGIGSRTNNAMMINRNSNFNPHIPLSNRHVPESKQNHARKSVKTPKRDIKSRLEFPGNVKQRLGMPKEMLMKQYVKASKSNVKQRLGSAPSSRNNSKHAGKNHRKLPWMKIQEKRCLEHLDGLHGVISSDVKTIKKKNIKKPVKAESTEDFESQENESVKIELPENSVEFMQSVQSAYLKYVKVLNENSAKRRKYTEQGGRGPFMCSICGSSKEFVDTLSLAQHALTSRKVGTRSEHLGFHKALCGLMGWTSADVPSSPWVRQIMPDAEAISLKEDLIVWPPIVIVHNSSVARENPDERLLVSIEGLWDILKGLGFGQWMTNVCRGKAANQSTMVVAFKGTFTGLREAQRLHRFYAENTRGRLEFEQIVSGSANESKAEGQEISADIRESKAVDQGIPADNMESKAEAKEISANTIDSVLYGYMGIASDLDKVDFETKRRSVVKSKKEIKAIADVSLAPE